MAMIIEYNKVSDFTSEYESGKLRQDIYKYILNHKDEERTFCNNGNLIENMNKDNIYDFFELYFSNEKVYSCEDLNYPKDNLCAKLLHKLIKECYQTYEEENQVKSITLSSDMDIVQAYLKVNTIFEDSAMKKGLCLYQTMNMDFSRKEAEDIYSLSVRAYQKTDISVSLEDIIFHVCIAIKEQNYTIQELDKLSSYDLIDGLYNKNLDYYINENIEEDYEMEEI